MSKYRIIKYTRKPKHEFDTNLITYRIQKQFSLLGIKIWETLVGPFPTFHKDLPIDLILPDISGNILPDNLMSNFSNKYVISYGIFEYDNLDDAKLVLDEIRKNEKFIKKSKKRSTRKPIVVYQTSD